MSMRSPRLIGREAEFEQLGRALQEAGAGRGSAVFLRGEPGVGKTRVAREVVRQALSSGMTVLRGRGSTTGRDVPFGALTEALLSYVRAGHLDLAEGLGPYRRILSPLVPDWSEEGGREPAPSPVAIAEAVLRLGSRAGAARGCLIFIDDLHEVDPETLAVVDYLAANVTGVPLVLLATVGTDAGRAHDVASRSARNGDALVFALQRLSADQVRTMIASCLDCAPREVPEPLSELLIQQSAGSPLVVEEFLHDLATRGDLRRGDGGWELSGGDATLVPVALVELIGRRVERLGQDGFRSILTAAVLGDRFPVPLVARATGIDEPAVLSHLRAAHAMELVQPETSDPEWYSFRHDLTVEALLAGAGAGEVAQIAGRVADTLTALHPDLPGEWCALAAHLRLRQGRRLEAGQLFLRAGQRALSAGACGSAVALLEQAHRQLQVEGSDDDRAEATSTLLVAVAEAGDVERAGELAAGFRVMAAAARDPASRAEALARLAWAAKVAGRYGEIGTYVETARALLPERPTTRHLVLVETLEAYAALFGSGQVRLVEGEAIARRAAARAEEASEAYTACQAWYAAGMAGRQRSLEESDRCFERVLDLSAGHRLTTWRLYAVSGLAGNTWLSTGDSGPLEHVHEEALRAGALGLAQNLDAVLALHDVLTGEFVRAQGRLQSLIPACERLGLDSVNRYALMVSAVLCGHRADRAGMAKALRAFAGHDGADSPERHLSRGLAQAFCALLEENRPAAEGHLADVQRASELYSLAGRFGLALLLDVIAGRAGRGEYEQVASTAAGSMRWNRQFVALSHAVLLGREGQAGHAQDAFEEASALGAPFVTARHLGMRLVAEAALEDGWGEPRRWLRAAEAHFRSRGVTAVSVECRRLLRRTDSEAVVDREGAVRVPAGVRHLGLTPREFEVYRLLAERLGNKALAARLHLSPRTVEKYVSALMDKIGLPNRDAVAEHAVAHLGAVMVLHGLGPAEA